MGPFSVSGGRIQIAAAEVPIWFMRCSRATSAVGVEVEREGEFVTELDEGEQVLFPLCHQTKHAGPALPANPVLVPGWRRVGGAERFVFGPVSIWAPLKAYHHAFQGVIGKVRLPA